MANPALFTARAGSDQIHPLTQLALGPVEWRNAATSSLCDIPHTIMHGPSSASHGRPTYQPRSYVVKMERVALESSQGGDFFYLYIIAEGWFSSPPCYIKVPIKTIRIVSALIEFVSNVRQRVQRGYCYHKSDWRNRQREQLVCWSPAKQQMFGWACRSLGFKHVLHAPR